MKQRRYNDIYERLESLMERYPNSCINCNLFRFTRFNDSLEMAKAQCLISSKEVKGTMIGGIMDRPGIGNKYLRERDCYEGDGPVIYKKGNN